jgi:hypothetical protein
VDSPTRPRLDSWGQAEQFGLEVAVATRHGGTSTGVYDSLNLGLHVGDDPDRVVANRDRAAQAFGVTLDHMVFAQQVHGVTATVVGPEDGGRGARAQADAVPETDTLITTSDQVTLAVLVADCVPLMLADPSAGVLAVVHAGWRGTAAGVVGHALTAMEHQGAQRQRIVAFLGPAVAPDRYQVSDEVHRGLHEAVAPAPLEPDIARPDGAAHWLVDLIAANRQQLALGGIPVDRIFDSGTTSDDGEHFSDRAQRPCGRFALFARLSRPASPDQGGP